MPRSSYGAVFAADGETLDRPATEKRRAEMQAQGLPVDDPISEMPADVVVPQPHDQTHQHNHNLHLHGLDKLSDEERVALAMSSRCCS